jgi:uncharacterized damage-inducible protein DinB
VTIKELFVSRKQAEHQGTITVCSRIPQDHLSWHPTDNMLTLGQLARHIWRSEEGTRRIALEADWTYYATRIPQGLLAVLGEVNSIEDELKEMERVHAETVSAAEAFPLERWDEIREKTEFHTQRSVGDLLFRIIGHHIHHRAQVGTYLRILTGGRASPYAD